MKLPQITVVAGLLVENGKFLIARRHPKDSHGGLWEFPGGKVELGESPEQALVREIEEELALRVKVLRFFGENQFQSQKADYRLRLYCCRRLSGTIYLTDHSEFAWIGTEEIKKYQFLTGDLPFLEELIRLGIPQD